MGQNVVQGAMLSCTFGMAPATLNVLPVKRITVEGKPVANVMDHVPMLNIQPFGMCQSLANPVVAAATAAAAGVLTPMPCIPATAAPWVPGAPRSIVGGAPALVSGSMCMCNWGGVISITFTGAMRTTSS